MTHRKEPALNTHREEKVLNYNIQLSQSSSCLWIQLCLEKAVIQICICSPCLCKYLISSKGFLKLHHCVGCIILAYEPVLIFLRKCSDWRHAALMHSDTEPNTLVTENPVGEKSLKSNKNYHDCSQRTCTSSLLPRHCIPHPVYLEP